MVSLLHRATIKKLKPNLVLKTSRLETERANSYNGTTWNCNLLTYLDTDPLTYSPGTYTGLKRTSAFSLGNSVVDEERMRPGHWLGSVLWVSFSALTLLVGWQEGHAACKNLCHIQRFFSRLIDWVKVLHPAQHKTGHFGDALPRQSLGYFRENKNQKPEDVITKIYNKPRHNQNTEKSRIKNTKIL